jgi:hypothetical protein
MRVLCLRGVDQSDLLVDDIVSLGCVVIMISVGDSVRNTHAAAKIPDCAGPLLLREKGVVVIARPPDARKPHRTLA